MDRSERDRRAVSLFEQGYTKTDIANALGVNEGTVRRIIKSQAAAERSAAGPEKHPKPNLGELPKRGVDFRGMLEQASERNGVHQMDQDYRRVTVKTDQPIAVMKASDLHFGGLDVDSAALLEHIDFLFQNDRFYLQLFGDDINMMVMHKCVGARHDVFTPDEQVRWLESFVGACLDKGKIISMGWGNHSDEFTERNAGFGIVRSLLKHRVPYFRGLAYLDLVVGKTTYPMGFAHASRFNSFMNPVHGNKRMQQMHEHFFGVNRPLCREYITAHTHNPAFATEGCVPDQRVHFIKCGTFKTNDVYSQRYFGQGRIGVPTVVYHPDRLEHICFPTPWEAYRYMNGKDWKVA